MLVIHHPDQALHDPQWALRRGKLMEAPDRAERYGILLAAARDDGHEEEIAPIGPIDPVLAVHDREYVEFLRTLYQRWSTMPDCGDYAVPDSHPTHRMHRKPKDLRGELGWYCNSTGCPVTAETWTAVHASAQVAAHGARRVLEGVNAVYALCRPPGHHVYPDLMSGSCFLNNASIAAQLLATRFEKVALVDIDVHHGNGSQHIFYSRSDVLFCSVHVDPSVAPPFYVGYADEEGEGLGRGCNINLPLPRGTRNASWLLALDSALSKVEQFGAQAVVVSLGLDAGQHDPNGIFNITDDGFFEAGRRFAGLRRPTLLVQEGGYLSAYLGGYLKSFLRGFENDPPAG
ncbi:histone deacetylase family protein [Sinorhizobium sp. 7-81]|uniref:histone deacetylase family protein n=1 Tax=Sinorhizobium sp. 8-89 TaxID=3049089 RepID=UPI0024C24B6B|nr:histone deacetylase family protein [Sinorhizobium sp. 8-89]MDK1493702.1 histone deacetylase family protein [Sinorhizobium sp. 8-89]